MSDEHLIRALQDAIRSELSRCGWTYRDLSAAVGVSEVSIKRWMTGRDLSLQRVSAIASALDTTIFRLMERAERGVERSFSLDVQTEQLLVDHPLAHTIWEALRLSKSHVEIREHYQLDAATWLRLLGRLEAMDLIELHPGDRVVFRNEGVHNWIRDGPLWNRHQECFVEALRGPLLGTTPSVVQSATRVVGREFWAEAELELLSLARSWRDRAWRDQALLPATQHRRVSWTLVLAEAPDFPEVPRATDAAGSSKR